ncbi:hypothetical protein FZEAL_3498 [Fusarium zealandicum]|uniref:Uncharacterized protein n=1 Tax=Fusarium zealandicum TaxID=1053134 RepID=A0A8H4XMJ1_9HYPO|nr:hypothetical protein FZEAL_3498 [Fusarium zealandicum]
MQSHSTTLDLTPFSGQVVEPVTLALAGQAIVAERDPSNHLYELGRDVTAISPKPYSAQFQRIEYEDEDLVKAGDAASLDQRSQLILYLVHPENAQYRTDLPAYYITAVSPEMPGNIVFQVSKTLLQKPEFKAMISPGKTTRDSDLFDATSQKTLFHIKPKWQGGQYQWTDSGGVKVAYESSKNTEHKLVILEPLTRATRDVLAALWALRIWHDVAESRAAKRDELERLTAPDKPSPYPDMKWAKRAGALGAAAGGGGA